MTPDKIVLLIIKVYGGKIEGKTLLQKRAYFLSVLLKMDIGYHAHFYGPYSATIESGLMRAKALGFIKEQTLGLGIVDNIGFDARRYDYSLTEDGNKLVSAFEKKYPSDTAEIFEKMEQIKDAGDDGNYINLSIAAKTYYIVADTGNKITREGIQSAAEKLGWKIEKDALEKAIEFLIKLKLVNVK